MPSVVVMCVVRVVNESACVGAGVGPNDVWMNANWTNVVLMKHVLTLLLLL